MATKQELLEICQKAVGAEFDIGWIHDSDDDCIKLQIRKMDINSDPIEIEYSDDVDKFVFEMKTAVVANILNLDYFDIDMFADKVIPECDSKYQLGQDDYWSQLTSRFVAAHSNFYLKDFSTTESVKKYFKETGYLYPDTGFEAFAFIELNKKLEIVGEYCCLLLTRFDGCKELLGDMTPIRNLYQKEYSTVDLVLDKAADLQSNTLLNTNVHAKMVTRKRSLDMIAHLKSMSEQLDSISNTPNFNFNYYRQNAQFNREEKQKCQDMDNIRIMREKYDECTGVKDTFIKVLELMNNQTLAISHNIFRPMEDVYNHTILMLHYDQDEKPDLIGTNLIEQRHPSTLSVHTKSENIEYTIGIATQTIFTELEDEDVPAFMANQDFDYDDIVSFVQVLPSLNDIHIDKIVLQNNAGENVELKADVIKDIINDITPQYAEVEQNMTTNLNFGGELLLNTVLQTIANAERHILTQHIDFDFDLQAVYKEQFPHQVRRTCEKQMAMNNS